jgi:hypothetical protein
MDTAPGEVSSASVIPGKKGRRDFTITVHKKAVLLCGMKIPEQIVSQGIGMQNSRKTENRKEQMRNTT